MTDDAAQSAPTPAEAAPHTEVAAPARAEPTPTISEPTPVSEQATSVAPASVIPEESQSAPNAIEESRPMSQPPSVSQVSKQSGRKWNVEDRAKAAATHARKKDVRLAKIVEYARENGGKITNDEIEKLLHVSDATASRYAKILVARGSLRAEGKGRGARYTLSQRVFDQIFLYP